MITCSYAPELTDAQFKHLIHAILSLSLSAGVIQVDSRAIKNKSSSRNVKKKNHESNSGAYRCKSVQRAPVVEPYKDFFFCSSLVISTSLWYVTTAGYAQKSLRAGEVNCGW